MVILNIIIPIVLFGIWFVLSGFAKKFFIILGIVSIFIVVLFIKYILRINPKNNLPSPFRLKFYFYLIFIYKEAIKSSVFILTKLFNPFKKMNEQTKIFNLIKIEKHLTERQFVAICNSITATPGTIVIDSHNKDFIITVHAIDSKLLDGFEDFIKKVVKFF